MQIDQIFVLWTDFAVASSLRWVLVTAQKPSSLVQPGMVALVGACSIV